LSGIITRKQHDIVTKWWIITGEQVQVAVALGVRGYLTITIKSKPMIA